MVTMDVASEYHGLLADILPSFQAGTNRAGSDSTPGSRKCLFYAELTAELITLDAQLRHWPSDFGKRLLRPSNEEAQCAKLLREILAGFEHACRCATDAQHDAQASAFQEFVFPGLELIRRESSSGAKTYHTFPFDTSDPGSGDIMLAQFSRWN
jgi:hypothetical protein